jgi:hypothetical protein
MVLRLRTRGKNSGGLPGADTKHILPNNAGLIHVLHTRVVFVEEIGLEPTTICTPNTQRIMYGNL